MQVSLWMVMALCAATAHGDHPPPSNSYGVPHTAPGPYAAPVHHHHHHEPPAPSQSYGVPYVPAGPYAPPPTTTTTTTTTPAPVPSYAYGAPVPSPSYGVPAVPTGPYGGGSGTRTVPGEYRTTSHAVAFYAPLFRNSYVPAYAAPIPAPSPGYGVPSPSDSYGVPTTPTGPYGGGGSYAPTQRYKIGDALVRNWITQTLLYGGGRVTEHRVPDSNGNYRVVTNEEWDDQVPNYHYGYDIQVPPGSEPAGADTSASETRNGATTQGRYSVKLPDGRTQIVQYTADGDGYKANVSYA